MQTASSASLTYLASRSASEYTITALMPSSRQARCTRNAISPRLAIRIFLNISACGPSLDDEQRLAVFDRLPVLAQDLGDRSGLVGLDLVEDLHRLDDADGLAFLDLAADLHERLGAGAGRTVERAHHRRLDRMAGGLLGCSGDRWRGGLGHGLQRRGTGCRGHHGLLGHRNADTALDDAHLALGFGDFQFRDVRLRDEINQRLEFSQIHEGSTRVTKCANVPQKAGNSTFILL